MARSPQYWYDVIITEKQTMLTLSNLQPNVDSSQTLLNDVTTTSKVARWRFWIWCVAVAMSALDVFFDLFKIDLEEIAKKSRYGTLPWYVQKSYEYQHGDLLVLQNLEWKYAAENTVIQIVKRAAAQEGPNVVNLKVAKLVGGVPAKLDNAEEVAFTAYIQRIKPAGVTVNVITDDPDELRFFAIINYDPLVLSSTGELLGSPGVYPIEDAINAYRSGLNNDFNGVFENMTAIDFIQKAAGVKSAYLQLAQARYGANPFNAFAERYLPNAGHMIIDPATPLNTSLTYVPYVV